MNGKINSHIIYYSAPQVLYPGDEKVHLALKIRPHSKLLRVKYIWADDMVSVVGPYMSEPNIFEFKPNAMTLEVYFKFSASNVITKPAKKHLLIEVEEVKTNIFIYNILKSIFYILISLSFLPLISTFINQSENFKITILDIFSFPLPLVTIVSAILLSRKVGIALDRLSKLKIEYSYSLVEYSADKDKDLNINMIEIKVGRNNNG
jgi:hypothetical protein